MSDIKTLREAAAAVDYWSKIENTALAILCRREIERMEREAPVVSIKAITADALSAARDEGWNAALDKLADGFATHDELSSITFRALRIMIADLRKGPSHD